MNALILIGVFAVYWLGYFHGRADEARGSIYGHWYRKKPKTAGECEVKR